MAKKIKRTEEKRAELMSKKIRKLGIEKAILEWHKIMKNEGEKRILLSNLKMLKQNHKFYQKVQDIYSIKK